MQTQLASPASRRGPWVLLAGLLLLVWGQSITFQFVWDDQYFVQDLKSIRSLASVPEMFYRLDAQSSYPEGFVLFRPLRTMHYAVLFALGGGETPKPWIFHLANLAWHTAVTILFYNLLLLLLGPNAESEEKKTFARRIALICAAAFAVHPVVSEVVCWVKSLDDLMATAFVLASSYALLRWQPEQESKGAYVWAVILFGFAVYSKESAVPFALFCIPFLAWRTQRPWRSVLRLSMPFLTVAFVFILHRHFVIGRTSQTAPLSGSYAQTLIDTLPAGPIYGRLLAGIPPFCIDYEFMKSGHSMTAPMVMLGLVAVLTLVALSALVRQRRFAFIGAGFLWLLLCMLPFSNLIPMMQFCAERFLYLPLLGWIFALGAGAMLLPPRHVVIVIGTTVVLAWSTLAWNRSWIWHDSVTLFVQSHVEGPTSARLQNNAIAAVLNQPHIRTVFVPVRRPGRRTDLVVSPAEPNRPVPWTEIEGTLKQLKTLFPSNATANGAIAITKALQGKPHEAIPYFEFAAQQQPKDMAAWNNLAQAYTAAGQPGRAEEALRRADSLSHP